MEATKKLFFFNDSANKEKITFKNFFFPKAAIIFLCGFPKLPQRFGSYALGDLRTLWEEVKRDNVR